MTRIDFYHLQNQKLEEVLPKLLEKAYDANKKIMVKIGNQERVEFINGLLWSYSETSFIPHGSKKDGFAEQQPIWLTSDDNNPNNAEFLFLVDGAKIDLSKPLEFERIFNIFDGNMEDSLQQAREFWKELKTAQAELFYWQQNNSGIWQQKG